MVNMRWSNNDDVIVILAFILIRVPHIYAVVTSGSYEVHDGNVGNLVDNALQW